MLIAYTVAGEPAPQGSKRHVGNGRMIEASKRLKPWRDQVIAVTRKLAEEVETLDGPLHVRMEFRVTRPKTVKRNYPITRSSGDLDKLVRGVSDGIVIGGLVTDDSCFININASKRYTLENPGVTIYLDKIGELNEE